MMNKKPLPTIYELLSNAQDLTVFDWTITVNGKTINVLDSTLSIHILIAMYPYIRLVGVNDFNDLQNLFTNYKYLYSDTALKLYNALTAEYNILDNYNGDETYTETRTPNLTDTTTSTKTGTTTNAKTGDNTITNGGTDTTTTGYNSGVENSTTTFDDLTPKLANKSDNTGTDTNTTQYGGTNTTTFNTTDTVTNDLTDTINNKRTGTETITHTLTKRGNLGITTSQQMITSELQLRVNNVLALKLIQIFISLYGF